MRAFVWTALLVGLIVSPTAAQEKSTEAFGPIKIVPNQASQSSFAEIERWQKKLRTTKADIHIIDTQLSDALQFISQQIDVPIRIDHRALEEDGIDINAEISLETPKLAADTLLQLLLRELVLTYRIDATGIVATTWEEAQGNLDRRVYPIGDLVNRGPQSEPEDLIEVITSTVEPHLWEVLGGPASITHFQNSFIVDQTYEGHRQVQSLLERLREVKNLSSDSYATKSLAAFPPDQQTADVEAKLNSVRIPTEFADLPLNEVTAFLSNSSEIPILLDKKGLQDLGIAVDMPIRLETKDLSLKQTLDLLSQQYELSWYVVGGLIMVTSHEEGEQELEIRIYPVRDLVWHGLDIRDPKLRMQLRQHTDPLWKYLGNSLGRPNLGTTALPQMPDFDNLTNSITTSIYPSSWEQLGGPGSIVNYPMCDCLVVQQTREVHDKVAELLEQIRSQQRDVDKAKLSERIKNLGSEVVTLRYIPYQVTGTQSDFNKEDFQAIGKQVEQLIEPDSWADKNHFVLATQGGLIIRHQRDTQEKIWTYLEQIGIGPPLVPALKAMKIETDQEGDSQKAEPQGTTLQVPPGGGGGGGFF